MKSKIDKEGDIELAIEHCEARVAAKKRPRAEKKGLEDGIYQCTLQLL